jgi:phosphoenolpyruvate carboxykinase (GTP)
MQDAVEAFAREWAQLTGADRIEVVHAGDDARLTRDALAAGEILPVSGGRFYARSYFRDTARTEERTFVATADPRDRGVYNNWVDADEIVPRVKSLMTGASVARPCT